MKFSQERDFYKFYIEGRQLFKDNNEEVNFFDRDLDVATQAYKYLEISNNLNIYTLRVDGKLVGYGVYVVYPHSHHIDMKVAKQDTIYIAKEYRGHALAFISYCDKMMREEGIDTVMRQVTKFNNWSLLLNRLNYEEIETVYMKQLKE